MGLTEQRYKDIREKLDKLGYRQPMGFESLLLVEHLLADLLHTTDSLKYYKNIAQQSLEKCSELQCGVEPYKHDNSVLLKKCNTLHQKLIEERELAENQQKELKSRVRTLENINTDLEFICAQHLNKIHWLNSELAEKGQKLLNLQGIKINSSSNVKKDNRRNLVSVRSESGNEKRRPLSGTTQITLSSDYKSETNSFSNICNTSKNQYDSLLNELKVLKQEKLEFIEEIASIKKQVSARNEEIYRLQHLIEGGWPIMAVKGECFCCSCKDCCVRSNASTVAKKLQEQLKECQELQHEAMSRAVKLAERNKTLEEELSKRDCCPCKCRSGSDDYREEQITRFKGIIDSQCRQIEELQKKLSEMEKIKSHLEADKSSADHVLEGIIEERKRLNERINKLSIIERDLMNEIDRLNESNDRQKMRLVELGERLNYYEKLAYERKSEIQTQSSNIQPQSPIVIDEHSTTKNVPKKLIGANDKIDSQKPAKPIANRKKFSSFTGKKVDKTKEIGPKLVKSVSNGDKKNVYHRGNKSQDIEKDYSKTKTSNVATQVGEKANENSSKVVWQSTESSSDSQHDSNSSLIVSNSNAESPESIRKTKLGRYRSKEKSVSVGEKIPWCEQELNKAKQNLIEEREKFEKSVIGEREKFEKSVGEKLPMCEKELKKAKQNLIEEREKFEKTIKELTEKQMKLMEKLDEKQLSLECDVGGLQRKSGHPTVSTAQAIGADEQGEDGEPLWIKLERIQAERDYYYKEFSRLRDQIASVKDEVNACSGKLPSVYLKLERLLAERDFYQKEYFRLQEFMALSSSYGTGGGLGNWVERGEPCAGPSGTAINSGTAVQAPEGDETSELRNKLNEKEDEILLLKQKLRDAVDSVSAVDQERAAISSTHRGTIHRLEMERDSMRNDIIRLEEDRTALKEKLKDITESNVLELARLEKERQSLEDKLQNLESERRKLLNTINDSNNNVRLLEDEIGQYHDEVQKLRTDFAQQRSHLNHIKMLQEQTDRALSTSQDLLTQTEAELASALDRIQELELERLNLEREINSLRNDRSAIKNNLTIIDQEKDSLLLKVDEKTEHVVVLEKELKQRDNRISYLEEILADLQDKLKTAAEESAHYEELSQKAVRETDKLRQELVALERSRDHAVRENKRLQDDLASMTQECVSTSRSLEIARQEVEDLKMQLQGYVAEVQQVEEILQAKESERTDMLEQYRNLTMEATALETNNHSLENEAKSTRNSLRAAEEKISDLERTVLDKDALVAGYEAQIADLTTHVAGLEIKLNKQVEEKHHIELELSNLKELCSKMEVHKNTLSRHVDEIENDKAHLEKEYHQMICKKGTLEEQLQKERKNSATLENILAESRQETLEKSISCNELRRQIEQLKAKVDDLQIKLKHGNEALRRCQIDAGDCQQQVDQLQREVTDEIFQRARAEEQTMDSFSSASPL